MKTQASILSILGVATLLAGGVAIRASAQNTPSPSPSASPSVGPTFTPGPTGSPGAENPGDRLINAVAMNYLHHVNLLEVQEGANAQAIVQSQSAQALAQALVTDHQQIDQQVTQLATQKGITLVPFQEATYEAAADSILSTLSPPVYDQVFMQLEQRDHQEILSRLQTLAGEVTDPDIQNLINQTIPIMQKHLELASVQPVVAPTATATPEPSMSMNMAN